MYTQSTHNDSHKPFIEISDPEIDVQEIMRRIREGIERKRQRGLLPNKELPRFGLAKMPPEPVGEHDVELYYHLERANDTCRAIEVKLALAPSVATALPILGKAWSLIRRQMHELVVYYVSMLAQAQARVNCHIVSVLNRLVAQHQRQAEELDLLRQEVQNLRAELRDRQ